MENRYGDSPHVDILESPQKCWINTRTARQHQISHYFGPTPPISVLWKCCRNDYWFLHKILKGYYVTICCKLHVSVNHLLATWGDFNVTWKMRLPPVSVGRLSVCGRFAQCCRTVDLFVKGFLLVFSTTVQKDVTLRNVLKCLLSAPLSRERE